MKKTGLCILLIACMLFVSGCTLTSQEKIKLRDLDFTVLSQEMIPEQLLPILEEKKASAFQITYTDNANLYICVGYGEQETGGYSIAVDDLYLTEENIVIDTSLLGPEPSDRENAQPSCPIIVVKTEYLEQTVTFE